jgi:branched-chain amino acid transport system substrate-binding protein
VVVSEGATQEVRDYRTQIAKVKAAGFDYVYVPVYAAGGVVLTRQLKEAGVTNDKIIASEVFNDPKYLAETKGISDGIILTVSQISPSEPFKQKVMAKLGSNDVPICAPQGYDAFKLLAMAMKEVGTNPDRLQEAIRKTNIKGESGPIAFDQNGDLSTANYTIKKIINGEIIDLQ